jgi:3-phytase
VSGNALRFFLQDEGGLREVSARPVPIGFAGESLCLYRNARDQGLYAYALGGEGEIAQFQIFERDGRLDANLVRQLHVASEASYCVTDDRTSDLYVAEQAVGVWRFGADPEADATPQLIDAARLGRIAEEVGGLALHDGGEGARRLIVSNASADNFHVYDREADHAYLGTFSIGRGPSGVRGVKEAGGLHAVSWPVDAKFPTGVLLAMDDDGQSYKTANWADVASALGFVAGAPQDPRNVPKSDVPVVRPTVETTPVGGDGDAADDPAIWVDPVDPARSLIIGTDKRAGLYVYDLEGQIVQFLPDGRMNNVDLRDGFRLGGRTVSLVTASNRTERSIAIYIMDPETRRLVDVADGVQATGFKDPYGLCMYRNRRGRTFVFVNDTDGTKRQWELIAQPSGKVRTRLVREFKFETQVEGCVADDEAGVLYVAEEGRGLWRLGAEANARSQMKLVASPATHPALKADLEGIGLFDRGGGRGYLVLSSQGNDTYAVFRREGNNAYVGSFAVVADPALGIDGASETDGLDVTSRPLGPAFPQGLFIAQDGRNVAPRERQNFKLVPWERIAQALGLD